MDDLPIPLDRIKKIVEECGAKFTTTNLSECTHLVTTEVSFNRKLKKSQLHQVLPLELADRRINLQSPRLVNREIAKS
jgi:hypothetical protein